MTERIFAVHDLGSEPIHGVAIIYKETKTTRRLEIKAIEDPISDEQADTFLLLAKYLAQESFFDGFDRRRKDRREKTIHFCCGDITLEFVSKIKTGNLFRVNWHPNPENFNHDHNNSCPSDDDNPSPPQNPSEV